MLQMSPKHLCCSRFEKSPARYNAAEAAKARVLLHSAICNFYLLQDKVFHCTCVSSVYKNVSLCVYQSCKTEICLCVVVLVRILAASNDDHVARRDRRFKQRYKLCSYLTSSATVVLCVFLKIQ